MLTDIDIERLPSFNIGFERGEEKGEARVVRRLLSRLGVAEVSELLGLAPEDVERIAAVEATRIRHAIGIDTRSGKPLRHVGENTLRLCVSVVTRSRCRSFYGASGARNEERPRIGSW